MITALHRNAVKCGLRPQTTPSPAGAIAGTMRDVPTDALIRSPRGRVPGPPASAPVATSAPATLRLARIALGAGVVVALFVWVGAVYLAEPFEWGALGTGHDARPYWAAAVSYPYANAGVGAYGAYLYSPVFLQVLAPIRAFPWTVFLACWEAILLVGVAALSGPVLLAPVVLVAIPELWGGNVTILLALAIVLGFRWPATWSFVLLTKVTPGVGLLWFAVRREWRSLAIALGATALVIAASAVLTADAWVGWVRELIDNVGPSRHVRLVPHPAARPPPGRRRRRDVGRAHGPPLDRPGRVPPRAPGHLVREPHDAARRHPARHARGSRPGGRSSGSAGARSSASATGDRRSRDGEPAVRGAPRPLVARAGRRLPQPRLVRRMSDPGARGAARVARPDGGRAGQVLRPASSTTCSRGVRDAIGRFVGADGADLALVPNATAGVSTVLRSLRFRPGDELLATDQEYNASLNALRFAAERDGARVVVAELGYPAAGAEDARDRILAAVTPRTRLAMLSHVTSPTAIALPLEDLVGELRERGVETLVDGAHAPGMLPLDLDAIGAAYYTGNCHKWVCAPKGAAFLHVRRGLHGGVRPLSISHGANDPDPGRTAFRKEFDWTGTDDPTAYLAIPAALDVMGSLLPGGWPALMASNRALAIAGRDAIRGALGRAGLDPGPVAAPDEMVGSMATVALPGRGLLPAAGRSPLDIDPLQQALWDGWRIEVPILPLPAAEGPRGRLVRISAQAYDHLGEYELLGAALAEVCAP